MAQVRPGIFTALELIRKGAGKSILMVRKRSCHRGQALPEEQDKALCKLQALLQYNDGLLRRRRILRVPGITLHSASKSAAICPPSSGEELAQETIDYADGIYLEFGADTQIEGISDYDECQRDKKTRHTGGAQTCRLPNPPSRYREGAGNILCYRKISAGKRASR